MDSKVSSLMGMGIDGARDRSMVFREAWTAIEEEGGGANLHELYDCLDPLVKKGTEYQCAQVKWTPSQNPHAEAWLASTTQVQTALMGGASRKPSFEGFVNLLRDNFDKSDILDQDDSGDKITVASKEFQYRFDNTFVGRFSKSVQKFRLLRLHIPLLHALVTVLFGGDWLD